MNITKSVNYTKRDNVKAGVAVDTVQEHNGEVLVLTGILFGSKYNEEDGKEVEVVVLKTSDDNFISSISKTVKDSAETIASSFTEEEIASGIEIVVKSKKSKGGRDFFYLDLK